MTGLQGESEAVIEVGKELKAAQDRLAGKGRDGMFRPWVQRCGFSKSAAYRAIAAFETFGKCPTVGHLFDPKALYLLSAPSCPEEATAEAIERAEKGVPTGRIPQQRGDSVQTLRIEALTSTVWDFDGPTGVSGRVGVEGLRIEFWEAGSNGWDTSKTLTRVNVCQPANVKSAPSSPSDPTMGASRSTRRCTRRRNSM